MEKLYSEAIGHKNNFNFLRLILAASVIYTHGYVIYLGVDNNPEPLWLHSKHQLSVGTLSLNFFFVISGFLVLQSWLYSKGALSFLKKRVLRIYPGFIVVCIMGAFVFGPMGGGSKAQVFQNYYSYLVAIDFHKLLYSTAQLLPPALPPSFTHVPCANEVNTSIWTIWYEFVCYLFILLAGLAAVYKKRLAPLIIFLVVYALNIYHFNTYAHYNENNVLDWQIPFLSAEGIERLLNLEHFSMFFLSGACFYYYRDYIFKTKWLSIVSILLLVITIRWIKVFELTQVIFGSYLLFCVAFSKQLKLYNFAKYGDFSYGVYLYGWPVQQLVYLYFGDRLSLTGTLFVSLSIVFPLAMLSWHLVEKQFLKLKRINLGFTFLGNKKYKLKPVEETAKTASI